MNEVLKPVGQWISQNVDMTVLAVIFVFSIFFKIPKKEINILGWFIGWIGKCFSKELRTEIIQMRQNFDTKTNDLKNDLDAFKEKAKENYKSLETRMGNMEESNDMQTIRQIKAHVLDFANSCLNGRKHTKQDFENIIKENEDYESLVSKYGLRNDVYTEDYKYIMKIYHTCQEKHSFLKDETL